MVCGGKKMAKKKAKKSTGKKPITKTVRAKAFRGAKQKRVRTTMNRSPVIIVLAAPKPAKKTTRKKKSSKKKK